MDSSTFLPLLLVTGLAFIVPVMATRLQRLRIPIVVGELLAGIIIGRSGFDLVGHSEILDFLAEFGFAFLMFLSGLEIDVNLFSPPVGERGRKNWLARPMTMAIAILMGTLLLSFGATSLLSSMGILENPLLLGLILSTTSLGVVVPVLKEKKLISGRYGQAMLVTASVSDFVTLLLLTIVIAARSQGLTLDLLLIPALLAVFFIATRMVPYMKRQTVVQRLIDDLSQATTEVRVRGAFALLVAWVVLAEALGIELILGAFLAGVIAGMISTGESGARQKLDGIGYGFFIPIFFINVGIGFNLPALFASSKALLLVPIMLGVAYMVKLVPSLLFRLRFTWRETFSAGFLLSSRLSLIIAASAIALELGEISEATNAAAILLAILTCTISPIIFGGVLRQQEEPERQGVIIIGSDHLTELVARRLHASGEQVTVLDTNHQSIARLARMGLRAIYGDANDDAVLLEAGAATARGLVALCDELPDAVGLCGAAGARHNIPVVVARVSDLDAVGPLQSVGVRVIHPAMATAMALEGALRFPLTFDIIAQASDDVIVGETSLANPAFENRAVRGLELPGNALILSLRREGTLIVPDSQTRLRRGDCIAIIGSLEAVKKAVSVMGSAILVAG